MSRIWLACGVLLLLGGCAGNDLLFSKHQGSIAHVGHWKRMAENSAVEVDGCLLGKKRPLDFFEQLKRDVSNTLPSRGAGGSGDRYDNQETVAGDIEETVPYCWADVTGLSDRSIFVAVGDRSTGFGRNFRKFLMAELSSMGHTVSDDRENAVVVKFHVDAVRRNQQLGTSVPGFFSLATYTLWAFKGDEFVTSIFPTKFARLGVPLTAGLLADSYMAHEVGGPQLVVTTSLSDGSNVLMRNADGYFVSEADLAQYVGPLGPIPESVKEQIGVAPNVATLSVVEE